MVSLGGIARKIFGSSNDRRIKSLRPRAAEINGARARDQQLSDDELRARPPSSAQELANGATLDDLLVPAFAMVREAARRVLGMRPFDVQLIGGMVLHSGAIAEMRTGEGKTLVATLPVYLNALDGKGVHVVTVNDYLAKRDSEWMGRVYSLPRADHRRHRPRPLRRGAPRGLCLRRHLRHQQRARLRLSARQHEIRARADGAARPQLRDRRRGRFDPDRRGAHAADHFRSARGPLGNVQHGRRLHRPAAARGLRDRREAAHRDLHRGRHREDREHAARGRPSEGRVALRRRERRDRPPRQQRAEGAPPVPAGQGLHRPQRRDRHHRRVHRPHDARPPLLGRPAPGAGSQGARGDPAGEPDAGLGHLPELFPHVQEARRHDRHGATEAEEFGNIYGLDVTEVPTNLPVIRLDEDDEVYRTVEEKYKAIVQEIRDAHAKGQPILVGTTSIEKSEQLAERLRKDRLQGLPGPERPLPRAGSLYRRAGRRAGRHHHRHQHGRPRHRHPARRQCRHARRARTGRHAGRAGARREGKGDPRRRPAPEGQGARRRRPLRARHRTPRKPPHRQPAARPLRPPGRPRPLEILSCRSRTI